MTQSILDNTKKMIGLDPGYSAFDLDVITHINSAFATLDQLGVGPSGGFMIEDSSPVWGDFLGDDKFLNMVKAYLYLKVRLGFDPPPTSFAISALQDQIKEIEWRLNVYKEATIYTSPQPKSDLDDDVIIDGGTP